jgi:hypothetical protein
VISAGSLAAGTVISGPGIVAGTQIVQQQPGGTLGGTGTYVINQPQTVSIAIDMTGMVPGIVFVATTQGSGNGSVKPWVLATLATEGGGLIVPSAVLNLPLELNPSGSDQVIEAWTYNNGADVFLNYIGNLDPDEANYTVLNIGSIRAQDAVESTSVDTGTVIVTSGVGIAKNLNVGGNIVLTGNLTVNGTTTTLNSTVVTVDDPIFTLGGDGPPGSDDNKDRGIAFRWYSGTAKIGFFGFDDSAQQFTFIPDATISSEVVSGSAGTIAANLNGNATSADTLSTGRSLWGQSFNGSGDITGNLTSVGDITSSDAIFSIGTTSVSTVTGNRIAITGGTTSNTIGSGGYISLTGGSATASTGENFGGDIDIAGGASTLSASGTGGSVSILAGNGATKGSISIGTSNTASITIGATGTTTTLAGTISGVVTTIAS